MWLSDENTGWKHRLFRYKRKLKVWQKWSARKLFLRHDVHQRWQEQKSYGSLNSYFEMCNLSLQVLVWWSLGQMSFATPNIKYESIVLFSLIHWFDSWPKEAKTDQSAARDFGPHERTSLAAPTIPRHSNTEKLIQSIWKNLKTI